ncbi:hypothetical protein DERP_007770 [Dermatophagoides pteronyssinus]|uniref:Uncharacterized protein n=1 Tax=Dermatophagoides pteronyssinus TaxID=6956 RepID=A0ABQ8ISJ9_DERPT|nr:hypothetical protein DERP_007770 [Dermatophagoides pteronyssinus]
MSKWTLNIGICLMWMIVIETWIVMTQRRDQYLPKPHATDTICQSFQQNSGSNLNILAIGTTSDGYLRLITKNNLSYVMPAYALDTINKKLYLMTWPQPLDIQYSQFFQFYKAINKFNLLVWFMFDQESDWICVATNYSQTQDAFNYDIKHKSAITGWYYLEANLIVLSTSAKCKFYTIQVSTSLRIDSWQCEKSIKEFPKILPKTGYDSVICFDESGNNITIVRVKDEPAYCIKPVQWPIFKGFVDSGNFYLFGHSYVYVFDEAAYYDDRKIYPFQQISNIDSNSNMNSNMIIMLIWIFMVIIWSIFFTCRRRRARQQLSIHEKTIRSGPMNSKYIFSKLLTKRSRKSKASRMNSISLQNGAAQPTVMVDNQAASSAGSICVDSNMISNTSASRSKRSSKRSPSSRRAH